MHPTSLAALLTCRSGKVLLVRRKESLLWTLPGGSPRPGVRTDELLASYCRRQIGVIPDFVAPFSEFSFAGKTVAVGFDEVSEDAVRACGRVEVSGWFLAEGLPVGVDPTARMAIALHRAPAAAEYAPEPLFALAC